MALSLHIFGIRKSLCVKKKLDTKCANGLKAHFLPTIGLYVPMMESSDRGCAGNASTAKGQESLLPPSVLREG